MLLSVILNGVVLGELVGGVVNVWLISVWWLVDDSVVSVVRLVVLVNSRCLWVGMMGFWK